MYTVESSSATTSLQQSNPTIFSNSTIQNILQLSGNGGTVSFDSGTPDSNGNVTVAGGTGIALIGSSNTLQTTITPPTNAPVVIFQGKGGVVTTFDDHVTVPNSDQSHVDRVVVGSAGNDRIIVADAKNSQIVLGSGDSSVQTGQGVDTVQAGLGNSTIVGGTGDYAVVKLSGNASNYQVTTQGGHAIVTDQTTHKTTDISKIQYVQLDNGNAMVFAKDSVEAQVSDLFHVTFGRDADAGGLNYWFDLARAGASMKQIAEAFTQSSEFATVHQNESDTAFVQSLYQNTFGRAGEDAGVAYWLDNLAHGATRADLINSFAQIAVQNIQHTADHQEAQVIGSITIIQNII